MEKYADTLHTIAFEMKRTQASGDAGKLLLLLTFPRGRSPNLIPITVKEARHQQP